MRLDVNLQNGYGIFGKLSTMRPCELLFGNGGDELFLVQKEKVKMLHTLTRSYRNDAWVMVGGNMWRRRMHE